MRRRDRIVLQSTPPEVNPYAPPSGNSVRSLKRTSNGSYPICFVSGVCALAYIAFTMMLLRSSSPGQEAGMLFLGNVPVLIGLVIFSVRSLRISMYVAVGAASVQVAITIAMLMMMPYVNAPLVIGINSIIVFICLAIAMWTWRSNRLSVSANHSIHERG